MRRDSQNNISSWGTFRDKRVPWQVCSESGHTPEGRQTADPFLGASNMKRKVDQTVDQTDCRVLSNFCPKWVKTLEGFVFSIYEQRPQGGANQVGGFVNSGSTLWCNKRAGPHNNDVLSCCSTKWHMLKDHHETMWICKLYIYNSC